MDCRPAQVRLFTQAYVDWCPVWFQKGVLGYRGSTGVTSIQETPASSIKSNQASHYVCKWCFVLFLIALSVAA
jgi:hypothetical protein